MRTLRLDAAANFLGVHRQTARKLAASGELPAAKIGRSWCFIEDDLVMYMRSKYAKADASQGVMNRRERTWHYTNEEISGGFASSTMAKEYRKALGLVRN